jgi:hypothetical protein
VLKALALHLAEYNEPVLFLAFPVGTAQQSLALLGSDQVSKGLERSYVIIKVDDLGSEQREVLRKRLLDLLS